MPDRTTSVLRAAFAESPDAIVIAATDRRIVKVNAAFETLFGYREDEVVGRTTALLYEDECCFADRGASRFNPKAQRSAAAYRLRYRRRDGTLFDAETVGNPVRDEAGLTIGFVANIRDTSARERLFKTLRAIVSTTVEPRLNFQQRMVRLLALGCEHFGLETGIVSKISADSYTVKGVFSGSADICAGQEFTLRNTYCSMVIESAAPVAMHHIGAGNSASHPCYRKLGLEAYIGVPLIVAGTLYGTLNFSSTTVRATPFNDDDLAVIDIMAQWVAARIQDRRYQGELRDAYAQISASEELYQRLYRESPVMMHSIDVTGRIVEVNDQWLAHLGYPRDAVIGRMSVDFMSPESRRNAVQKVLPAFFRSGRIDGVACDFVRGDGTVCEVEVSAILDRSATGTDRSLEVLVDVGERNRALRELGAHRDELEEFNQDMQQFTHVASHDLREPLRKIRTFTGYLADTLGTDASSECRRYMQIVADGAERLDTLLVDLLDYTRTGHTELKTASVSLRELCFAVLDDMQLALGEAGGSVHVGDLPEAIVDPSLFRVLLQNLIGNAIRYRSTARALRITIDTEAAHEDDPEDAFDLVISDNGIGFEPEYAEQIFAPFARLHGKSAYPGTGIGLAIATKIARRHGLILGASGVPDQGAKFRIRFPSGCAQPVVAAGRN